MIKKFNGYEEAKEAAKRGPSAKLPKGAYVCKILGAKVATINTKNGDTQMLQIQFDVSEGEYAGFFKKLYEETTGDDKKYKGKVNIYLPKDDGTEQDTWTKNAFAKWTNSLEESNEGYHWDWNEAKWKDKLIGLVFGETGTRIEGKDIIYTECRFPVSVQTVRDGKAPEAKFKAKGDYGKAEASTETDFMNIPADIEDELPFK